MLDHSQSVLISGGTFNQVTRVDASETHSTNSAFKELQNAAAPAALHNSNERFDAPKCHPHTRTAVLERLMKWVMGHEDCNAIIMWLYGAAGAGKSAIAQTMAGRCDASGLLLASFFFSRTDPSRNNAKTLFPTLAYQIVGAIPDVKEGLERRIVFDPLIFQKSLEMQVKSLIIDPLHPVIQSGFFDNAAEAPRLIIIDGLDECNDPQVQSSLLNIIAKLRQEHHIPFKFLIASRPERTISHKFNSPMLTGLHTRIPLSNELHADEDLRQFLAHSFAEVKATHPRKHLIPDNWPPRDAIDTLVEKSSGQFIYASASMKYVSSIHDLPTRCLDIVLGLRSARYNMPFAELDALYMHIFSAAKFPDEVLLIMAFLLFNRLLDMRNTVHGIEKFLNLEKDEVEILLDDMPALISFVGEGEDRRITIMHASVGDFLLDSSRSGPFHLDSAVMHTKFSIQCLQGFMRLPPPSEDLSIFQDWPVTNYVLFYRNLVNYLSIATPTEELIKNIADCALRHMFGHLATVHAEALYAWIPRYLMCLNNWNSGGLTPENIFVVKLHEFDSLLVEDLDKFGFLAHDYILTALMVLSEPSATALERLRTVSKCFAIPAPPFVSVCLLVSENVLQILFEFITDPARSKDHGLTGSKYAVTAKFCLDIIYNRAPGGSFEGDVEWSPHLFILETLPELLRKSDASVDLHKRALQSAVRISSVISEMYPVETQTRSVKDAIHAYLERFSECTKISTRKRPLSATDIDGSRAVRSRVEE